MLVKFFNHGTRKTGTATSRSVKDYLLNERLEQGTARLIRGNEPLISSIIDNSPYSSTYTAGCLSFGKGESLTDEQKHELMESFEQALLPNFDPTRYGCYWVEHTDKDRLELNFVFAKIDLATGKHLDVYQHRRDVARLNCWKEIQVQHYGLLDPNAPKHKRDFCLNPIKRADGTQPNDKHKTAKQDINDYINQNIELGQINNSQDIKKFIEYVNGDENNPTGYIVKQNKTGITITDSTTNSNFRLQGAIYARDFTIAKDTTGESHDKDRIVLDRQQRQTEYDNEKAKRLEQSNSNFRVLSHRRERELERKFGREPKVTQASLTITSGHSNRMPRPALHLETVTIHNKELNSRKFNNYPHIEQLEPRNSESQQYNAESQQYNAGYNGLLTRNYNENNLSDILGLYAPRNFSNMFFHFYSNKPYFAFHNFHASNICNSNNIMFRDEIRENPKDTMEINKDEYSFSRPIRIFSKCRDKARKVSDKYRERDSKRNERKPQLTAEINRASELLETTESVIGTTESVLESSQYAINQSIECFNATEQGRLSGLSDSQNALQWLQARDGATRARSAEQGHHNFSLAELTSRFRETSRAIETGAGQLEQGFLRVKQGFTQISIPQGNSRMKYLTQKEKETIANNTPIQDLISLSKQHIQAQQERERLRLESSMSSSPSFGR